jgi:regulator of protease activity HflC (stomatin/prohibitin superfamily)
MSASMLGLGIQLLLAVAVAGLAAYTKGNATLSVLALYCFGGLGVWACLWVVFQQHKLERIEALETEQLAQQHGTDNSIFEASAEDLSVMRRRLAWMHKWVVPLTSLGTSVYLIVVGVLQARANLAKLEDGAALLPEHLGMTMAVLAGVVFIGFLVSRYLAGMAKQDDWQMLRGGAGYLMGNVVASVLTLGASALSNAPWLMRYMAVIVPVLMVVIGAEILMNFILDFYRPRVAGVFRRPSFDSRLLSLLTNPESIAQTINEAINYQFGFEITRSWFWRQLNKDFPSLVLFGVGVLLLSSCFVVVETNQRALVKRFGRLIERPMEPGLHVKLPWPISKTSYYDVTMIQMMQVGSEVVNPGGADHDESSTPILWTNPHADPDTEVFPMIVAPPRLGGEGADASGETPSNSVVNVEVVVMYRIRADELVKYVRANADAGGEDEHVGVVRLRQIAESEVSRYMLRDTVDGWIARARRDDGAALKGLIQEASDKAGLGVELVEVSLVGVHPTRDVADRFHMVVGAEQERQETIEEAKRTAIMLLSNVSGSPEGADALVRELKELDALSLGGASGESIAVKELEIERMLRESGGAAAIAINNARQYRWAKENVERGQAMSFSSRLAAYEAAPHLYRMRHFLDVVQNGLRDARKYLIAVDHGELVVRGDLKDTSDTFGDIMGEYSLGEGN